MPFDPIAFKKKFPVGSTVILHGSRGKRAYSASVTNPYFPEHSKDGKPVTGTVTRYDSRGWAHVIWANEQTNVYWRDLKRIGKTKDAKPRGIDFNALNQVELLPGSKAAIRAVLAQKEKTFLSLCAEMVDYYTDKHEGAVNDGANDEQADVIAFNALWEETGIAVNLAFPTARERLALLQHAMTRPEVVAGIDTALACEDDIHSADDLVEYGIRRALITRALS